MRKWFSLVLLSMMLVLVGCTSNEVTYDSKNLVDYYLMGRDYSTLNSMTSMSTADLEIISNISDGMTETDNYGNKTGALAKDWTFNDDYTEWTFVLKDAVWSTVDGEIYEDITAYDFEYATKYVLNPDNASANAQYLFLFKGAEEYYNKKLNGEDVSFDMVGVKAIDEKTVQYKTIKPCPYLLSVLGCNGFYPANEKFITSLDNPKEYGSTPEKTLYSGAFLIERHTLDTEIKLVKNPNYYDLDKVNFDSVTRLAVKDQESVLEYFERGEISVAPLISSQVIKKVEEENPYLLQKGTEMTATGLIFNTQCSYSEDVNKANSNVDFRKSIFFGFDRVQLTELINPINPESILNKSFCARNFVKTSDGTDYTELGGLKKYQDMDLYQKDLALQYKQKAIDTLTKEGVTFPIVLKYWTKSGDVSSNDRATMIKEILETNLGSEYIRIEINEYATSFGSEVRSKGDYGINTSGWTPDYADPVNCLGIMKTNGTINNYENPLSSGSSHYYYPEFDAMVEAADMIGDLDERYLAFANAEAYLLDNAYYVPLYVSGGTYYMSTVNEFTRMNCFVGIDYMKYKGLEAFEKPITQDQFKELEKEWQNKK